MLRIYTVLVASCISVSVLAGCNGKSNPVSAENDPPDDEVSGQVIPVSRRSDVIAVSEPGYGERVAEEEYFGPDPVSFDDFDRFFSVESTGQDDFGRTTFARANARQLATFGLDAAQMLSDWTFEGEVDILAWIDQNGNTPAPLGVYVVADTQLDFGFAVGDSNLVLLISGGYEVAGDEFCVDFRISERDGQDRRTDRELEIDVCDEIGSGAFVVAEEFDLLPGHSYELTSAVRSSEWMQGLSDEYRSVSGSALLELRFQVVRR